MAYIDVPKVKGKIAEKGLTMTSTANLLNIDRNTLASYLKNPGKMPYFIVSRLSDLLCDNRDEAATIFFASDLR